MKENLPYIIPLLMNIIRYFLIAGIPFLIFYIVFPEVFTKNKIQARFAKRRDFIREILHSVQTTFILAGVGMLMLKTPFKTYTQVYDNLSDYPLWWIPLSVFLALIVHDTYFYWMHRAVHHPKLFKRVHLLHHKSVNPSPWTSYSFHIIEGVLEAMVAPLILVLIPMHPLALLLFTFSSFSINVYGHLGYEIAPRWFRHSWIFEILNTSTHHNLHHAKFKGNYGLYFRVWDRLMGTEHPDYVKEYDKIQERRFGTSTPSALPLKKTFMLLTILMGLLALSAKAQDGIEGDWKDHHGGGIIKIYEENGLYFGQLIGADKSEENQKIQTHEKIVLMKNFEKKSSTEYCCGTIYQPREKRTISATLILESDKVLRIYGRYGVFSGSRRWTRL